jgi:hypothetical protein
MKRYAAYVLVLALLVGMWACGKKDPDPQIQLPSYLRIPATLVGYAGSGRIAFGGGLTLVAEGPEVLDPNTKTYTGVTGKIATEDINAYFTVGQPRVYGENYIVPDEYKSNGQLMIFHTISPGTYPLGSESTPTPTGAQATITLNLPGPQIYIARSGNLTISESTLIKSEGQSKLYRIQGTFQTSLTGFGTGAKDTDVTGVFDLLLLN